MHSDEVFVVNTTTGIVTLEWSVQTNFSLASGCPYPDDWSHINDRQGFDPGAARSNRPAIRGQPDVLGILELWELPLMELRLRALGLLVGGDQSVNHDDTVEYDVPLVL